MAYELTVYNGEVEVEDLGFFSELQKVILATQEIDAEHNREVEAGIKVISETEKDITNVHVLREIKVIEDKLEQLGLTIRLLIQELADLEYGITTSDLQPLIDSETDESRTERRKAERDGKKIARKLMQACHPDNTDDFLLRELFQPTKEAFDAEDWDQIDRMKAHYDLVIEARRDRLMQRKLKQELLRRAKVKKEEAVNRLLTHKKTAGGTILASYREGKISLAIRQTNQLLKFQKGKIDEEVIRRVGHIDDLKERIKDARAARARAKAPAPVVEVPEPAMTEVTYIPEMGTQWESS